MKSNICLIGMSGVGKTYFGKLIAKNINFNFIDIDKKIEKTNPNWKRIATEDPEKFNKIERDASLSIPFDLKHTIISPGGSVVYDDEVMNHFKKISIVIYIESSAKKLLNKINDPSKRGIAGLKTKTFAEILEERHPLYLKYADEVFPVGEETFCKGREKLERLIIDLLHYQDR